MVDGSSSSLSDQTSWQRFIRLNCALGISKIFSMNPFFLREVIIALLIVFFNWVVYIVTEDKSKTYWCFSAMVMSFSSLRNLGLTEAALSIPMSCLRARLMIFSGVKCSPGLIIISLANLFFLKYWKKGSSASLIPILSVLASRISSRERLKLEQFYFRSWSSSILISAIKCTFSLSSADIYLRGPFGNR